MFNFRRRSLFPASLTIITLLVIQFTTMVSNADAYHYPERIIFFKPPTYVNQHHQAAINSTERGVKEGGGGGVPSEKSYAEYDYDYDDGMIKFRPDDNYTIFHRNPSASLPHSVSSSVFRLPALNRIVAFTFLAFFVFAFLCLLVHCLYKKSTGSSSSSSSGSHQAATVAGNIIATRGGHHLIICRDNRRINGQDSASQQQENAYGATYPLAPRINGYLDDPRHEHLRTSFKIEMPPPYEEVETPNRRLQVDEETSSVSVQINPPLHPPPYQELEVTPKETA